MLTSRDPRRWSPRADLLGAAGAATGSLAVAVVALRAWRGRLDVPMQVGGDAGFYLMLVKGVLDHGWHWTNPSLGAPFGQELYDFPQGGDNLNLLIVKFLGAITQDAAVATNLFFLLSFPLTALGAYAALRWLRVSVPAAALVAGLFALLPIHFLGGQDRLLLNAAYSVPIGCCLLIAVLRGDAPFALGPGEGSRWRRALTPRNLLTVAACVVVGSAGVYYAAFTIVLLLAAALVAVAARPSVRSLLAPLGLAALIGLVLAANYAPSIAHHWRHGGNPLVAERSPRDTETWALKVSLLVLPQPGHRVEGLAELTDRYARNAIPRGPNEAFGASLGVVGSLGALALLAIGLGALVGRRPATPRRSLAAVCAAGAGLAVLVGTQGGVSSLLANFVSPQIRVWSRISMFVAFLCLVAVALMLDRAAERFAPGRRRALAWLVAIIAVGTIGALDQTTNRTIPAYTQVRQQWEGDRAFTERIERRLPPGAAVFQLPYTFFPEDLGKPIGAYEPARGYFHSTRLRWSWGAMRGRPADWARHLARATPAQVARRVAAAGFDGIWVDRRGYRDDAAAPIAALGSLLGSRPLQSADRRFAFFDLRPYAARLRASMGARRFAALGRATLGRRP